MPSLVHEEAVNGPAMHALVIGVGYYPHLLGGDTGELYAEHDGMGQLTSPPLSAKAFTDWLTVSGAKGGTLGSVTLLIGGMTPVTYTHPTTGVETKLEAPTMENVKKAAEDWKERGNSNPDNLMLFYFCGHGIAREPLLALLLEDYGKNPDAALDSAIDFTKFHMGMERCKARRQCFFIDACRVGTKGIETASGYAGIPIFQPTTRRDRDLPIRQKPVFYSTFDGEKAQSRTNKESLFTEALLRALKGGGADDTTDDWWVDTSQLQRCIQFIMEHAVEDGYPMAQMNPVDDMSTFRLHRLQAEPEVPVAIGCRPTKHNQKATLVWECNGKTDQRPPKEKDWVTDLATGEYTFRAELAGGDLASQPKTKQVRPPHRTIELEVE